MARAAVSLGVAGVFIETHQDLDNAPVRRAEHDLSGPDAVADRPLMRFDALAKSDPVMADPSAAVRQQRLGRRWRATVG